MSYIAVDLKVIEGLEDLVAEVTSLAGVYR
jgi:hypothetical protein